MTILQIHKYYWHRDGASNYMLELSRLLGAAGDVVVPFAMKQEASLPSPYDAYFVSESFLDNPSHVSFVNKLRFAGRMLYSLEAKKNMERLLAAAKIDVAHLHNIYHHISPSILPVLKKRGIPIVMTLHDYKLICPNYTMFHHGAIHEEDGDGWYFSCIRGKCLKDSRAQSALVTAEMIFHHKIMKYYERYVDRFIAPSEFIMEKCIEKGWPREKFVHIPHPIDVVPSVRKKDGAYVTYIGRLSEEKGILLLLDAAKQTPDIPYRLVGDGPLRRYIEERIQKERLTNVELSGFLTGEALEHVRKEAKLMVVPSEWYENYPLAVLEPMARGMVVIGADRGGIPELLPSELCFHSGSVGDLVKMIKTWYDAPFATRQTVGKTLRQRVEEINNPEKHVHTIRELYASVCSK